MTTINERIEIDAEWHLHHLRNTEIQAVSIIHSLCEPLNSIWDEEHYENDNDTNGAVTSDSFTCTGCKSPIPDAVFLKYAAYTAACEPENFTIRDRKHLSEVLERSKHER